MSTEELELHHDEVVTNGASHGIVHYLSSTLDIYGVPILQLCIRVIYTIYLRLTVTNVVIFSIKYIPTGIFMYNFLKTVYVTSREKLQRKLAELEDIRLQIQVVNTKLSMRDLEFSERAELFRSEAERLRRVRTKVRDLIATDNGLRHIVETAAKYYSERDGHVHSTPHPGEDFITDLLKGMKPDQIEVLDGDYEKLESGEPAEEQGPEGLYSSFSDMEMRQDCRVKIVKVTNVYKVAYLRHYIKQKRLRRASRRALLKKKMENIKNLLEGWQKILNKVVSGRLTVFDTEHPLESQEAMGDYSKTRGSTDSDIEMRNADMFYDEYNANWTQSSYRPYGYNVEECAEPTMTKDFFEGQYNGDANYFAQSPCNYARDKLPLMGSIIEETGSQVATEEALAEHDDPNGRDYVAI